MEWWGKWFLTRSAMKILSIYPPKFISNLNILEAFEKLDRQDLHCTFIACENDTITPPTNMKELFDAVRIPKEFILINNAKHFEAPIKGEKQYQRAIQQAVI